MVCREILHGLSLLREGLEIKDSVQGEATYVWMPSSLGTFTTRSAYNLLIDKETDFFPLESNLVIERFDQGFSSVMDNSSRQAQDYGVAMGTTDYR